MLQIYNGNFITGRYRYSTRFSCDSFRLAYFREVHITGPCAATALAKLFHGTKHKGPSYLIIFEFIIYIAILSVLIKVARGHASILKFVTNGPDQNEQAFNASRWEMCKFGSKFGNTLLHYIYPPTRTQKGVSYIYMGPHLISLCSSPYNTYMPMVPPGARNIWRIVIAVTVASCGCLHIIWPDTPLSKT